MASELPKEIREEIRWKYALRDENGKKKYTQTELAQKYGVRQSYISIINQTNPETGEKFKSKSEYQNYNSRQITNPETDKKFESELEYKNYKIRQRTNPETGEKFKSKSEYNDYNARQKINPETGKKFESKYEYRKHLVKQKDLETIIKE